MTQRCLRLHVVAAELRGPGLTDWAVAQAVLVGQETYVASPVTVEPPAALSPAERRRAIPSVRLALAVAGAAVARSGLDAATLPAVFASSGADGETIGTILTALAMPAREVSPTRFHNSVHNAPSGYWSVAVQSREPETSLSAHDASFAAGLLEAAVQAVAGERPVLLISYDLAYPHPLHAVRPIGSTFGVAFVLAHAATPRSFATLDIRLVSDDQASASVCTDTGLEALRRSNPAARSLPLLTALAVGAVSGSTVRILYGQGNLVVDVMPC